MYGYFEMYRKKCVQLYSDKVYWGAIVELFGMDPNDES